MRAFKVFWGRGRAFRDPCEEMSKKDPAGTSRLLDPPKTAKRTAEQCRNPSQETMRGESRQERLLGEVSFRVEAADCAGFLAFGAEILRYLVPCCGHI